MLELALDGLSADGWVSWWVEMTLWSGALFVALLGLERLLRRQISPGWRAGLYLAVFVRVALPVDWASPLGVVETGAVPGTADASTPTLAAGSPELAVDEPMPALLGVPPAVEVDVAAAPPVRAVSAATLDPGQLAWLVYLLGVAGLLGRMVAARRRLRAALAHAQPARAQVLAHAGQQRVVEHEGLGPLACGVFEPQIVLPRALVDALSEDELACVIAHERAHLERRDPLLAALLAVATALAWPLLPAWLAAARIRHLIELATDARALASCPTRIYGQTLIKLAAGPAPQRLALGLGVALHPSGFARLRARVASLGQAARVPKLAQPLVVALAGALALACAGLGESSSDDDDDDVAMRGTSCETLVERATSLHDQAERGNDDALRGEASQLYQRYAEDCVDAEDYGEVVYYGAELLWARASAAHARGEQAQARAIFGEAHEAFRQALAADPGRFEQDAAYAQLLAKRNELGQDEGIDRLREEGASETGKIGKTGGSAQFEPSAYDSEELELLDALATYRAHVDDLAAPELQRVIYEQARLAMIHNRFDEAEPLLRELHAAPGVSELHVWGAEMLTDILTIRWTRARVEADAAVRASAASEFQIWPELREDVEDGTVVGSELQAWIDELRGSELLEHEQAEDLRAALEVLARQLEEPC